MNKPSSGIAYLNDAFQCVQPDASCRKTPGDKTFSCDFNLHFFNASNGKCPNTPQGRCAGILK